MAYYWDTSCVVKLYCQESDSDFYLDLIEATSEPVRSSTLLEAEIFFAFHQKWLRGETGPNSPEQLFERFLEDVERVRILLYPFGRDVIEESRRVAGMCYAHDPSICLRTLDGLHLATARLANCDRLLTTDLRMRTGASILGL